MDFDDAKENIQPLAQGRNASILQASLKIDSTQELMIQRKQLEKEIHNYSGNDELSAWFNYIDWIEQSFPSGGKESGLQEVLAKCLSRFESDERYKQDRRMIKLYIKYIDNLKDPAECYQQLFNAGIGTMVSDFYIAWAYCYDDNNRSNNLKAEEIFRRGIACRAQPLEDLQEAHQHFGFVLAQRFMYKDDDNIQEETNRQLHERRLALSSLRGHRRKQLVGSTRTGAAVKNTTPGMIANDGSSCGRSNARVDVFKDENKNPNFILTPPVTEPAESTVNEEGKSVVRSIIDAQRDQENRKEPGPWNKPHSKGKLFGKSNVPNELGFEIHKDDEGQHVEVEFTAPISMTKEESRYDKPLKLPSNFCGRNISPQIVWLTPVTTEERPDKNTLPEYNKCRLYPRPNVEFQPEELKAYRFFQKRGIENVFTQKRDIYLGRGPRYNLRHYPHFAKQSNPQTHEALDDFYVPPKSSDMLVAFNDIYNLNENVERQFEEILALRIKRNETIITTTDMEETICVTSEKVQRRKSFFPMRKSIAPCTSRGAIPKLSIMGSCATVDESKEEMSTKCSLALPIFEDRDKVQPQHPPKQMITKSTDISASSSSRVKTTKLYPMASCVEETEEINDIEKQVANSSTSAFPIFEGCAKVQPPNVLSKLETKLETEPHTDSAKPAEPFQKESFVSRAAKSVSPSSEPLQTDHGFQFKTPALPSSVIPPPPPATTLTKSNKIQFEIFEDNTNNVAKPEIGCGNGGYFDPDETCSTQTFNIFLRAQSVSTPKVKPEPQRMFGNVLRETIPQPEIVQKEEEPQRGSNLAVMNPLSELGDENSPAAATLFSPQHKQLSTILEISEHGTTQSTHTTGATTKSTISSPEFEQESQAQNTVNTQHQPTLGTVKERTIEDSSTSTPTDNTAIDLDKNNKHNDSHVKTQYTCATPGAVRFQPGSGGRLDFSIFEDTIEKNSKELVGNSSQLQQKDNSHIKAQTKSSTSGVTKFQAGSSGRLDFSIFEDTMEKNSNKQHAGNFSRLEEKEDTAAGFAIKPIRFQEDKTETISKMLLAPLQPVKYQEDKTETISRMLLAPPPPVRFQEETTETISRLLLAPPEPVRFEEDKTVTISKLMLAPPQPTKYEDELLPKLPTKETSVIESTNQDHFFEFFSQSPPKAVKSSFTKPLEIAEPFGQIRTAAENRTPIALASKRLCTIDSPVVQKSKATVLFEDATVKPKSALRDSFLPDFSLLEEMQRKPQQQKTIKPKSVLRDSFIPDFSLSEDSPPKKQIPQSTDDSFLPDLSHIPETQHISNVSIIADSQPTHGVSGSRIKQNSIKVKSQSSYLSHIPETSQPISNDSIVADSQPTHGSSASRVNRNSAKATLQSSYLPDFSMTAEIQPMKNSGEGQPATMKNILTDSFMKDFSAIKEPPPIPKDVKEMTMIQPSKNSSMLRFLEESLIQRSNETISKQSDNSSIKVAATSRDKNSFVHPKPPVKTASLEKKHSGDEKFFELNAETEMFGTNMSMIKNSTWLPNHGPTISKHFSQIQENSLHIKAEELSSASASTSSSSSKGSQESGEKSTTKFVVATDLPQTNLGQSSTSLGSSKRIHDSDMSIRQVAGELSKPKLDFLAKSNNVPMSASRFSIDISQSEWAIINAKKQEQQQQQSKQSRQMSVQSHIIKDSDDEDDDFGEMSIYYKHTPKTPKAQVHIWDVPEEDAFRTPANNRYMHVETDLNQTHQIIENICVDPNVNPFSADLINAFLEQIQFTAYIQGLTHCMMVRTIQRLKPSSKIRVNSVEIEVVNLIGEGAYGAVFCGKESIGGKKVAMKQENPANLWEFYICLEIQDRIIVDEMLPAFMSIDYALIGNNSSILISQFSPFGSLISVCNKIKKHTMKNVDEYVVMLMASELLEIIDHLHAVGIIHADIKADNFLLMNKLSYPPKQRCLQLIDFGVSIDMKHFKSNQTFSFVHNDNSFKCIEMREQRPWTYQLDLFGLAGVLHVLLFAKYMDVEKKSSGIWMHKTHVPRYFNRNLWDAIFKTLLNIRDCNSMPNLQNLRASLKEEIVEKEKYVIRMVNEFNRALET